jgi:hypothetical protein
VVAEYSKAQVATTAVVDLVQDQDLELAVVLVQEMALVEAHLAVQAEQVVHTAAVELAVELEAEEPNE